MDEEVVEVVKAVPKKTSRILELADGSEDDTTIKGDTEIEVDTDIVDSGEESETAEAELGKRLCLLKN